MSSTSLIISKPWGQLALLCLLVWLAYGDSFPGAFHFDDFQLMLENPRVSGRTFDYELFLSHYGGRPLTLWTFHLNHRWGGDDPAGYHVLNVFLHVLAGWLLFQTAVSWGLGRDVSLLGAAIFLVHPLQTQPVNYIWSRSLLLMSVWSLVSILTFRRSAVAGLGAFQLAIWSRAEALVLTPLLLVARSYPRGGAAAEGVKHPDSDSRPGTLLFLREVFAQNRRSTVILFVLALLNMAGLWWGIRQQQPPEFGLNYSQAGSYWWSQPWAMLRYISWFLWPSGLSIDHDASEVGSVGVLLPAFIVLAAMLLAARAGSPARRLAGAGWLMGLAMLALLPSALVANPDILNESRPYLAMAALSMAAAILLLRMTGKAPVRRALIGLAIVLPLILVTRNRNEVWQSDVAIWEDAVQKAPARSRAHYNLGAALAKRGDTGGAEEAFRRASRLNPFDDLSYAGLGFCAELEGRKELARRYYQQAVELAPANHYAQEALARVVARSARDRAAEIAHGEKLKP